MNGLLRQANDWINSIIASAHPFIPQANELNWMNDDEWNSIIMRSGLWGAASFSFHSSFNFIYIYTVVVLAITPMSSQSINSFVLIKTNELLMATIGWLAWFHWI